MCLKNVQLIFCVINGDLMWQTKATSSHTISNSQHIHSHAKHIHPSPTIISLWPIQRLINTIISPHVTWSCKNLYPATQYREYISKRNQNISTFQERNLKEKTAAKTIHGTRVGQGNELVTKPEVGNLNPGACKRKDVAGPQSEKLKKPDTFVKRRRESSSSSLSDVTNEDQPPQNISDDEDVYNYDFTGIWENDAFDYHPDTSQIAEVQAFNIKKKYFMIYSVLGTAKSGHEALLHIFWKENCYICKKKRGPL